MRSLGWALCAASAGLQLAQGLQPVIVRHDLSASSNTSQCCTSSAHLQEVLTLSELPLERLLRVRVAMHPLERAGEPAEEDTEEEGEALPQAEALRSRHRDRERGRGSRPPPMPRGDIIESVSSLGPKQSKLATGFQLAITVLSFLAFGAYLISLVVSIVRNNNTSTTATTQQPFVLVPSQAGKKRKRKRRSDLPDWMPPSLLEPDRIFNAISKVAQAYARFEGHDLDP